MTIDFPPADLGALGERDRAIELCRTFGLIKDPASELRVCAEFEPTALSKMPTELRALAEATEHRWHAFLECSPRVIDHFAEALLDTPDSVGGRGSR